MEYDFKDLTENQQKVLTYLGWTVGNVKDGYSQPSERTMKKLIARGLAIPHYRQHKGVEVIEYEVPLAVHMAWCQWCAEQP